MNPGKNEVDLSSFIPFMGQYSRSETRSPMPNRRMSKGCQIGGIKLKKDLFFKIKGGGKEGTCRTSFLRILTGKMGFY
jgi:hypothetical protein